MGIGYQPDTVNHRWSSFMNVSGLGVWQYSQDSKGRTWRVTNNLSQVFGLNHNLDGSLSLRTWPNGVTEQRAYNPRGFLSQIQINQPGVSPAKQFNYNYGYSDANPPDYDGTGHVRREVDEQGQTHAFFFDDLYELIGESDPALGAGSMTYPYDVNYTFDLNGNRTSRSQGSVTDYYHVDAADRLQWVNRGVNAIPTSGQANPYTLFGYDLNDVLDARDRRDNNNILQQLWFWADGADHLRKATTTSSASGPTFFDATYNADGMRTAKDDTRAGVLQHNDFSGSPYGLLWSSNPTTVYTPGFAQNTNGTSSFFQTDWLGSTRYVTDSTGSTVTAAQSYDAWGSRDWQAAGSPNNPTDFQFAGGWGYQTEWSDGPSTPGLGLDYLQQRYYDPVVGRFMAPDPIGFGGGLNLYQYAGDDPVDGVDPLGLDPSRPAGATGLENFFAGVGATLGGAGGFFGGGGAAVVTTGPFAVITGPPAAFEMGTAGSVGGYAAGRAFGHWLSDGLMHAMSGRGGSSGGSNGCGQSPSEILRQNMIDAGMTPPDNSAAHHIVAWNDSRAYLARRILASFGIDVNSAVNGVYLPLQRGMQGVYHPAVHTDLYYETVTNLLGLADTREEALSTLEALRQALAGGGLSSTP